MKGKLHLRNPCMRHNFALPITLTKKKGFRYLYIKFESSKDHLKQNQQLESAPADLYHKAFLLRQRVPEKEIGPPKMKFKANTAIERVMDKVNGSSLNNSIIMESNVGS